MSYLYNGNSCCGCVILGESNDFLKDNFDMHYELYTGTATPTFEQHGSSGNRLVFTGTAKYTLNYKCANLEQKNIFLQTFPSENTSYIKYSFQFKYNLFTIEFVQKEESPSRYTMIGKLDDCVLFSEELAESACVTANELETSISNLWLYLIYFDDHYNVYVPRYNNYETDESRYVSRFSIDEYNSPEISYEFSADAGSVVLASPWSRLEEPPKWWIRDYNNENWDWNHGVPNVPIGYSGQSTYPNPIKSTVPCLYPSGDCPVFYEGGIPEYVSVDVTLYGLSNISEVKHNPDYPDDLSLDGAAICFYEHINGTALDSFMSSGCTIVANPPLIRKEYYTLKFTETWSTGYYYQVVENNGLNPSVVITNIDTRTNHTTTHKPVWEYYAPTWNTQYYFSISIGLDEYNIDYVNNTVPVIGNITYNCGYDTQSHEAGTATLALDTKDKKVKLADMLDLRIPAASSNSPYMFLTSRNCPNMPEKKTGFLIYPEHIEKIRATVRLGKYIDPAGDYALEIPLNYVATMSEAPSGHYRHHFESSFNPSVADLSWQEIDSAIVDLVPSDALPPEEPVITSCRGFYYTSPVFKLSTLTGYLFIGASTRKGLTFIPVSDTLPTVELHMPAGNYGNAHVERSELRDWWDQSIGGDTSIVNIDTSFISRAIPNTQAMRCRNNDLMYSYNHWGDSSEKQGYYDTDILTDIPQEYFSELKQRTPNCIDTRTIAKIYPTELPAIMQDKSNSMSPDEYDSLWRLKPISIRTGLHITLELIHETV